jgi:hypothetical protein
VVGLGDPALRSLLLRTEGGSAEAPNGSRGCSLQAIAEVLRLRGAPRPRPTLKAAVGRVDRVRRRA